MNPTKPQKVCAGGKVKCNGMQAALHNGRQAPQQVRGKKVVGNEGRGKKGSTDTQIMG